MHCADLGNPAKMQDTMLKWTNAITEEFFRQGDSERELGLPVSPMMDRSKPNVEKSQVGFIDVIVGPLFRCFQTLVPEVQICLDQLQKNKEYWLAQLKSKEPVGLEVRPTIRSTTSVVPTTTPSLGSGQNGDRTPTNGVRVTSVLSEVVKPKSTRSGSIPTLEISTPKANPQPTPASTNSPPSPETVKITLPSTQERKNSLPDSLNVPVVNVNVVLDAEGGIHPLSALPSIPASEATAADFATKSSPEE